MKQILFPVDFSPQCDAMAPFTAALARRFDARLALLHVMATGSLETEFTELQHHFGTLAEEIQGLLARYRLDDFRGLDPDRIFKIGRPAPEIVAFAHDTGTDLIMMPTHGRSRFRSLILGSTTAGVLHDTGSAVLTTAHAEAPAGLVLPRSIVCAIDMGPQTAATLDLADHFAIHCGAALRVIHVVPAAGGEMGTLREEEVRDLYPELARAAEVKQKLEIIRATSVTGAILDAARDYGAGLLVAGRGQMQGILGRLRSGIHELIRRSPCPVLSV